LVPEGFIHKTIKGHEFSRAEQVLSGRDQGVDPFGHVHRLQVEIAGYPYWMVSLVGDVDFEILIKYIQTATGLEGQDIFYIRVHDIMDF
jgi:hypothetical protein